MKRTLLLWLVVLAGCTEPMSNEAIIAEVQKCESGGLRAAPLASALSNDRIFAIECRPRAKE